MLTCSSLKPLATQTPRLRSATARCSAHVSGCQNSWRSSMCTAICVGSADRGRCKTSARRSVSSRASTSNPVNLNRPEGVDTDTYQKCLQAAIDLQERGWAIVDNVFSQQECDDYISSLWDWLEGLGTGVKQGDPSTWTTEAWPPTYRGILNTLEIAHQSFVWRIRKQKRLQKIFELLLGTNELLTSFDAINVLAPHNEAPPAGWLHVDQTPLRPHLACLQGLVNLVPVSAETSGTLMVKDKSNKVHQDFFHTVSGLSPQELANIPDHYQFTPDQLPYWDHFDTVKLQGGAGSLFLWDSRTTHSNTYPAEIKSWRHVVYTCYQPRSMASQQDLEMKAEAYHKYQITTHLPAQNIRVYNEDFAKLWPSEAKVLDTYQPDYSINRDRGLIEDNDVRRLAGVEPYPAAEIQRRQSLAKAPVEELKHALNQLSVL